MNLTCAAFPAGIPEAVLGGQVHNKPLPDQVGTLVYEPYEAPKEDEDSAKD